MQHRSWRPPRFANIVREQNLRVMAEIVADHDPLFTSKIAPHMGKSLWPHLSIASTRSQQTIGLAEGTLPQSEGCLAHAQQPLIAYTAFAPAGARLCLQQPPDRLLDGKSPLLTERGVKPLLPIDLQRFLQRQIVRRRLSPQRTGKLKQYRSVSAR